MAYKYGNSEQTTLFPQSVGELISEDDPVRVYDAFINALDLKKLGIHLDEYKVGNSEYDPRAMLKLLVYGYSYGFRSSRKLERAIHHNLSFIWLVGGLKPDFKTISNFRRRNKTALKKVLKLCAKMCVKLNLIEGNTLFVDGTKIRANVVDEHNDLGQMSNQINQAQENIEKECNNAAADTGYSNTDELKKLDSQGILLRGLEGVRAEFSLMSTCFNISRMITLLGVRGLIRAKAV